MKNTFGRLLIQLGQHPAAEESASEWGGGDKNQLRTIINILDTQLN